MSLGNDPPTSVRVPCTIVTSLVTVWCDWMSIFVFGVYKRKKTISVPDILKPFINTRDCLMCTLDLFF